MYHDYPNCVMCVGSCGLVLTSALYVSLLGKGDGGSLFGSWLCDVGVIVDLVVRLIVDAMIDGMRVVLLVDISHVNSYQQ